MIEKINDLLAEVGTLTANDEKELEALRIKYLSKKGVMNELMTAFRDVPGDQKRELGQKLNTLKNALQDKINGLRLALSTKDNNHDDLDLTRTPYPIKVGTRHPLSIVKSEIIDIFSRLGFSLADGPEIEDDWHVFSSMKIIRHATCRTRSSLNSTPTLSSAPTPVLSRAVSWKQPNRPSV